MKHVNREKGNSVRSKVAAAKKVERKKFIGPKSGIVAKNQTMKKQVKAVQGHNNENNLISQKKTIS